ncbi:unnamed protein product [Moneuplotes crassus]|uniref:Uncharacterized protein n=1 Tax=Euplotes crassus TaxID=5936 RepID=A0AAD1UPR6_EUPCR|nr:unnamed protein product [Moneuplotes crassus]
MTIIYTIFFILAQLGGLYAILTLLFGLCIRPINEKCFEHECVNSLHKANKIELEKLRKEAEERGNQMGQNLNDSMLKNPNEDEPLIQNEEAKVAPLGDGMSRSRSKRMAQYQPGPTPGGMNGSNRFYNTSMLFYNILCPIKLKSRSRMAQQYQQYKRDVDEFNYSRDLVTIVSKINTLQFKINSMEELISKHEEMEIREMMNAQNEMQNESEDEIQREKDDIYQSNVQPFNQAQKVQSIVGQEINPNNQVVKQATQNINNIINPVIQNKPEDPTPGNPAQHPQVVPNQAQEFSNIQAPADRDIPGWN